MKIPQGLSIQSISSSSTTLACRLNKSLYGLRQASRQWYAKLSSALQSRGFHASLNDYSLFTKLVDGSLTVVVVYVDDILVAGDNLSEITTLKQFLDAEFKIKDLGELYYFLGLEITRKPTGFLVCQHIFIMDLLDEFHFYDVSSVVAPLDPHVKLFVELGELLLDPSLYRRLVGKLNYLQHTRPNLSFTVQHLSQFMSAPRVPHLNVALHVLRYLCGTSTLGLLFSAGSPFSLQGYCDSDWASCAYSRRSVSDFILFLGGYSVSWKSKKQPTIALSSTEAEYRALRFLVAEITWILRLLAELGVITQWGLPSAHRVLTRRAEVVPAAAGADFSSMRLRGKKRDRNDCVRGGRAACVTRPRAWEDDRVSPWALGRDVFVFACIRVALFQWSVR
nr:uncharacterized mitochondrial protein AtMg00810-like [Nicotiana tomentosiformis]